MTQSLSRAVACCASSLLVLILSSTPEAQAQMVLHSAVIGAGGAPSSNGTIVINGTFGQSAIGPVNDGVATALWQGFWYSLPNLTPSDVREEPIAGQTGDAVMMMQNVPNPFSDVTDLRIQLPRPGHVSLKLFDRLGREAMALIDGEREAGTISLQISAADLESGSYTAQLIAGGVRKTITMIVIK